MRGELAVDYEIRRDGLRVAVNGESLADALVHGELGSVPGSEPASIDLEVAGLRRTYLVSRSGGARLHVRSSLGHSSFRELPRYPSGEKAAAEGALVAPMPGRVIKLAVEEGADVGAGELIAVLEAMKMEHELTAPVSGRLSELRVAEGDQLDSGAIIGVIEAA